MENFRGLVAENIRRIGEDRDFLGLSNTWERDRSATPMRRTSPGSAGR